MLPVRKFQNKCDKPRNVFGTNAVLKQLNFWHLHDCAQEASCHFSKQVSTYSQNYPTVLVYVGAYSREGGWADKAKWAHDNRQTLVLAWSPPPTPTNLFVLHVKATLWISTSKSLLKQWTTQIHVYENQNHLRFLQTNPQILAEQVEPIFFIKNTFSWDTLIYIYVLVLGAEISWKTSSSWYHQVYNQNSASSHIH